MKSAPLCQKRVLRAAERGGSGFLPRLSSDILWLIPRSLRAHPSHRQRSGLSGISPKGAGGHWGSVRMAAQPPRSPDGAVTAAPPRPSVSAQEDFAVESESAASEGGRVEGGGLRRRDTKVPNKSNCIREKYGFDAFKKTVSTSWGIGLALRHPSNLDEMAGLCSRGWLPPTADRSGRWCTLAPFPSQGGGGSRPARETRDRQAGAKGQGCRFRITPPASPSASPSPLTSPRAASSAERWTWERHPRSGGGGGVDHRRPCPWGGGGHGEIWCLLLHFAPQK